MQISTYLLYGHDLVLLVDLCNFLSAINNEGAELNKIDLAIIVDVHRRPERCQIRIGNGAYLTALDECLKLFLLNVAITIAAINGFELFQEHFR